ncbi:MAG TPA: NnrS family protein, partial [Steroidobacteraceae bacterium]|nr:NnrS family protein [Steroidobacteraceae bacterium]
MIALFGYGFRPFFLAAGLAAFLLIPWWTADLAWGVPLATRWPPALWHGHEMLFGFIVAAIAGFLLTAVPSWTGARGFAGWPLAMLAALWLLGRLCAAFSGALPAPVAAVLDLAFLPALAGFVLPPLMRARSRNTPLLIVLLALWASDVAFYRGIARGEAPLARHALLAGIDIVLLLLTVIGGRIVPAFTSAAFRQQGRAVALRTWRAMTPLAVGVMLAVVLGDIFAPESGAAGGIALAAALIQGVRLAQWRAWSTRSMPIVWVLHLAYLWLPIGLALKALALIFGVAFAAYYLHALTIGAAALMIMAVMTRAALGHTGRALVVTRS